MKKPKRYECFRCYTKFFANSKGDIECPKCKGLNTAKKTSSRSFRVEFRMEGYCSIRSYEWGTKESTIEKDLEEWKQCILDDLGRNALWFTTDECAEGMIET